MRLVLDHRGQAVDIHIDKKEANAHRLSALFTVAISLFIDIS